MQANWSLIVARSWTAQLRHQLLKWPACVPSIESLKMSNCSPQAMAALAQLACEGQPRVLLLLEGVIDFEFALPVSAGQGEHEAGLAHFN